MKSGELFMSGSEMASRAFKVTGSVRTFNQTTPHKQTFLVAADGDDDNDGDDAPASSLTSSLPYLPHKHEKARSRRVRAT